MSETTAAVVQTLTSWICSSSEILSIILNQGVYPEPCETTRLNVGQVGEKQWTGLSFPIGLHTGEEGEIVLGFSTQQAGVLIDLLVGGDGNNPSEDLVKQHQSVLQEAVAQMVGGLGEILSTVRGKPVKVQMGEPLTGLPPYLTSTEYLWLDYPMSLDDGPALGLSLLLSIDTANQLTSEQKSTVSGSSALTERSAAVVGGQSTEEGRHQFKPLVVSRTTPRKEELGLILDVPLQVQVVLGRSSLLVQDLIHLGEGSILELDKLAGEPVELYVHDRLVALGEVIVIEERFGVKVLELAEARKRSRAVAS